MAVAPAQEPEERLRAASRGDGLRLRSSVPPGFWVVSGGILIVWAAHNALALPWEVHHIDADVREPVLVLLRGVLWMVPVASYQRRYESRPRLVALGVTSPIDGRGFSASLVGAVTYMALVGMLVTATAAPGDRPKLLATLVQLPVLCSMLSAVLEELLMRGFLLRQLVRFTSSFRAQACVAVLFGLMHLPAWIALEGVSLDLLASTMMITVLGAGARRHHACLKQHSAGDRPALCQ